MERNETFFKDNMVLLDGQKMIFYTLVTENVEQEENVQQNDAQQNDTGNEIDRTACSFESDYLRYEVGFCPYCKKMSKTTEWAKRLSECEYGEINRVYSAYYSREKFEFIGNNIVATCPHCKKDLTEFPARELSKSKDWELDNLVMKAYSIFKEEDKLKLVVFFETFFPNTKAGKLGVQRYNFRVTFNLKTGMTYILEPRECDNKKRRPKWDTYSERIRNITFDGTDKILSFMRHCLRNKQLLYDLGSELVKAHGGKLEDLFSENEIKDINSGKKFFNYEVAWGDYHDGKSCSLRKLTLYNKFHVFGKDFNNSLCVIMEDGYCNEKNTKFKRQCSLILEKSSQDGFFHWLAKRYKLPNCKSVKKLVLSNPFIGIIYNYLKEIGFSDINLIIDIIKNNYNYLFFDKKIRFEGYCDSDIKTFISDLISLKGEVVVKKMIFDKCCSNLNKTRNTQMDIWGGTNDILTDTARMYVVYKNNGYLKAHYLSGNLKEIHDKLALDYRKIRTQNKQFTYTEEELNLADEIDGYQFVLAKDIHELIDVGASMGICVGSYGEFAYEKRCTIVLMKEQGKYVGCIELKKEETVDSIFKMIQAKAKYNNLLQEKKAEALQKWVDVKEIGVRQCYDYDHIRDGQILYNENEIYQGTHNYHHF